MELKKNYFPTAKAPDIAKKKVMQYIYWSQKNLSKRFYFYRVYVPSFLLLFMVLWWVAFYNKEMIPINGIKRINTDNEKQQLLAKNPAIRNFVSNDNQEKTLDNNIVISNGNVNGSDRAISMTQDASSQVNDTTIMDNNVMERKISNAALSIDNVSNIPSVANTTNATSIASPNNSLTQQISEIENLMNDISSITNQEELLF